MRIINNRIRIPFVIQFILILLFPTILSAQSLPQTVLATTQHILKNEFYEVASRYLLPSYYSESKVLEEKQGISDALHLLSQEFGDIIEIQTNQRNVRWVNLEIFGGDVDFIKNHPNFAQYVFKTKFSILGDGFIIIRVYDNNGDPQLRSVGYALPDSPQSREKLQPIGKKLMKSMFPQEKPKST